MVGRRLLTNHIMTLVVDYKQSISLSQQLLVSSHLLNTESG